MQKIKIIYSVIILAICLILPMIIFAQADPPGDTPIDGGVTLLLAAGAAYGVKKYREHKKKGTGEEGEK